jgi:hypothetical protein
MKSIKAERELSRRNSAKYPRIFGRRGLFGKMTYQKEHRIGGSDCLVKTQVSANS